MAYPRRSWLWQVAAPGLSRCGPGPATPKQRIALVGETAADVRDVMVEGESGIYGVLSAVELAAL